MSPEPEHGSQTPRARQSEDEPGYRHDPHMRATALLCGECNQVASNEAWTTAWWRERSRRSVDPAWNDDDYGEKWGLTDKMVCPRCGYVHADDEASYVQELAALIVVIEEWSP